MKTVDTIVSQIGSAEGIVCFAWGDPTKDAGVREFMTKYGVT